MIFLWIILLFLASFSIVYTYAIYPVVLTFFKQKEPLQKAEEKQKVSVFFLAENISEDDFRQVDFVRLMQCVPEGAECFLGIYGDSCTEPLHLPAKAFRKATKADLFNEILSACDNDIVVIADLQQTPAPDAISKLISHFSSLQVACVSGQQRDESGKEGLFWKYENKIKILESRVGALSGVSPLLYAFRKEVVGQLPRGVINPDFFIATKALQEGNIVLFEPEAVVYERNQKLSFKDSFHKHVCDGSGYYQALFYFKKLFSFNKGSFVYVSHRVLKWLVPFALPLILIVTAILAFYHFFFAILFILQCFLYLALCGYLAMKKRGFHHSLAEIGLYFFSLNLAWMIGFVQYIRIKASL